MTISAALHEWRVYGKPADREDARRMLSELGGRDHWVHTGYAVLDRQRGVIARGYQVTKVWLRRLDPSEEDAYLATGIADDKAGAYAVQDRRFALVQRLEGSAAATMGLPVCPLRQVLLKFGLPVADTDSVEGCSSDGYGGLGPSGDCGWWRYVEEAIDPESPTGWGGPVALPWGTGAHQRDGAQLDDPVSMNLPMVAIAWIGAACHTTSSSDQGVLPNIPGRAPMEKARDPVWSAGTTKTNWSTWVFGRSPESPATPDGCLGYLECSVWRPMRPANPHLFVASGQRRQREALMNLAAAMRRPPLHPSGHTYAQLQEPTGRASSQRRGCERGLDAKVLCIEDDAEMIELMKLILRHRI